MANFSNHMIATINYIECPMEVTSDLTKEFEKISKEWLTLPSKIHALDFRLVKKMHPSFYAELIRFQRTLLERGLKLVSINISQNIEEQLKKDGVIQVFGFIRDFKTVLNSRATKPSDEELRPILIKYLVEAARRAMETLFEVTVAADENFLENLKDFRTDNFHRAATMDVSSDALKAKFRLYFPKETLFNLTRKMVGETATDEETTNSTATELLNMIYGGAKSHLNEDKSYNLPPAIPTLVLKEQISSLPRLKDSKRTVCIPFASPLGTYHLEVDFG